MHTLQFRNRSSSETVQTIVRSTAHSLGSVKLVRLQLSLYYVLYSFSARDLILIVAISGKLVSRLATNFSKHWQVQKVS
jgi:hypothetical protein